MTTSITALALRKTFGRTRALDGLDLEVEAGEVHGFLGPNGSGKSTTIRVLLGLLRADGGTVRLLGGDPWRDAVPLHRRLAYVPGDVTLWPNLSGGEVIDLYARLRGPLDPARRAELLDRFQLDPAKKGRTYSKGNRQKVALVAAFASDAELLILDEPTSGLAMLTVTYLVAARWTTPRRAVLTVLLALCGLGFLRRLPEFLNDIGSTGLLLVVVYLLTRAQEHPGSRALLALPPFVLAAFYLRYGVAGNVAAIVLAALLAYGARAWLARGRQLAVAGAVILAGLVPHFVHAIQVTGSPLGLVFWATSQAERQFVGDGLLYYLAIFPYRLAGDLGGVVMAAGFVAAYAAVRRLRRAGEPGPETRRWAFLGLTSVLVFVLLGVATDGEPRFVYLPVVLLTVLGVQALARAAGEQRRRLLAGIGALALLTTAGTAQSVAHGAMPGPTGQARSTVPVARALAADGTPCLLVTGYEPESGWYSGCDAMTYRQYRAAGPPAPGTRVSFVRYERGRHQPGDPGLAKLTRGMERTVLRLPATGVLGEAHVVTVRVPD
ncbi:ABC transporter ATP-binding protein [Streptomyces sp. McG5]|nr:ABC transporter ATP-binding protein [Streptomyces sp. McG5]